MERTHSNGKENFALGSDVKPFKMFLAMETEKKQLGFFCLTSALPYISSGEYALPFLMPTNPIYWHGDLPSPGPITSHPSQHHWGTSGECSPSTTHCCAAVASPWGVPPSAWSNSFHKWLTHFPRRNISTSRKYGGYWGSSPTGKRPSPRILPEYKQISRVSIMSLVSELNM